MSGFSFSSALADKQAEKSTQETKPVTSSGFSFATALSTKQASADAAKQSDAQTSKVADKPAGGSGFSFASALGEKQSGQQIAAIESQLDGKSLLTAAEWQRGEVELNCIEKWHETHDVVSFRFQGLKPVKFNFKPGQFLTFKLNIDGKQVYRSYTIASSPSRPYSLVVTIKEIPDGLVSNHLANTLNVGDTVSVTGPDGLFNLIDIQAEKYLFLSAGSGVTPMHSMSRWLNDTQVGSDIAFVHSARSASDVIFAKAMAQMTERNQSMSLGYVLESAESQSDLTKLYQDTALESGRLDIDKLAKLVPDYQSRTVFICGPDPYMQAVKQMLEQAGFNMANFHQESFGSAPTELDASSAGGDASARFMLEVSAAGQSATSIELTGAQSLLEGIESAGLPIVAACRSGVCGSCKCKVTKGEVNSKSSAGLTPQEVAEGYVLACSSKLTSDASLAL
ncbi:hybrid-cluster NAD(P)-dependent oxidoreductase [Shewanella maritima]|uniref:Hybrid-cluster NAD(P)-dependent oxidoreductase n=1 Tax=Shewanella maritima TaxID=2520507 RepID=A0A411PGF1_9GAMM|nr:hybrid-cluster NAD(P)-dependent oxidoreductase [Shewanella maritima]QBF82676.1 hybrid-cluster NAD(P)-dependent oxidoreductase [Shewanella maritima]